MGAFNTPPVSPREPEMDEESAMPDQEELEVYEVVYDDDIEEDGNVDGDDEVDRDIEEVDNEDDGIESNEEIVDNSLLSFKEHNASVFCCSVDPKNSELVVSGGEDDKAFVWNITDGKVVFECTNHKDSVTSALFSHDSVYLATADMCGFIQVWKVATKSVVWSFEVGDINWVEWHPGSHVLFAGAVEGETWMWKIPSGDCKTFPGHGERNECGKILPDGRRLAVGYVDGSVKVFDLKTLAVLQHLSGGLAHTNAVSCLDCFRDNNLIVSGSLDATAKLFNTQTGKIVSTISCEAASTEAENSVEAVSFCPDTALSLLATGTLSGKISFWDIPTQVERQSYNQCAGVIKFVWHPTIPHLLFSAGLDGVVRLIDARTGKLDQEYTGHSATVLDISISNDGKYLVTSSDDQTCRVFETKVDQQ